MKKTLRSISMLLASISFVACEQGQGFADYDQDGDGMWNETEFYEGYEADFGTWDADGDNNISDTEFYETTYGSVDANDDALIDESEWSEGYTNLYEGYAGANDFTLFDENEDGTLDSEEWNEGFADSNWFGDYDGDSDGLLSNDELNRGIFSGWDENQDGNIDEGEYNKFGSYYLDAEY